MYTSQIAQKISKNSAYGKFGSTPVQQSEAPYEDGTLGLYNVIVPRSRDYTDVLANNERRKIEQLRDSVEGVLGRLSPDSYIAGGALTSLISGEKVNDIDVFGTESQRLIDRLTNQGFEPTLENNFIVNFNIPTLAFTRKLQIIKNSIDIGHYLRQLDNIANGILIGSRETAFGVDSLVYEQSAVTLARKKIIRLRNPLMYPKQNLSRALKYISRGWKIEVDSLANLAVAAGRSLEKELAWKDPTLELFSMVNEHG
jgi:hypothetical protein